MDLADLAVVYFNPQTIAHKKLKPISIDQIKQAFNRSDLQVFTESQAVKEFVLAQHYKNANLLMMSSGTFDGIDMKVLATQLKA